MAFSVTLPTPVNLLNSAGESGGSYGGPGFASVTLTYNEGISDQVYNSGRYDMARATSPQYWGVEISYNELECSEFHVLYSFLLRKQESMEPFYVELPQYAGQGISNKTVVAPGGWGTNTVIVSEGTEPVLRNSVFTILNKFYVVTRVETATDYSTVLGIPSGGWTGKNRVHVAPTFQDAVESGSLNFTNPAIKVCISDESLSYSIDPNGLFSFSLNLEECRP